MIAERRVVKSDQRDAVAGSDERFLALGHVAVGVESFFFESSEIRRASEQECGCGSEHGKGFECHSDSFPRT
jgi:hypothetical protein